MRRYKIVVAYEGGVFATSFPDYPHLFALGFNKAEAMRAAKCLLLNALAQDPREPTGANGLFTDVLSSEFVEVTEQEIEAARERMSLAEPLRSSIRKRASM